MREYIWTVCLPFSDNGALCMIINVTSALELIQPMHETVNERWMMVRSVPGSGKDSGEVYRLTPDPHVAQLHPSSTCSAYPMRRYDHHPGFCSQYDYRSPVIRLDDGQLHMVARYMVLRTECPLRCRFSTQARAADISDTFCATDGHRLPQDHVSVDCTESHVAA